MFKVDLEKPNAPAFCVKNFFHHLVQSAFFVLVARFDGIFLFGSYIAMALSTATTTLSRA
jgi:hypothetical protein